MNGLKLTTYQLADLLFRRDGGGVLLSLCREEEAEYVTESGDFLRFAPCDPETRGRVRAQAEEEGISLWEDSSTVYATAAPAASQPPEPAASPDASANSYSNSGSGEIETYRVLIQPMEEN